MTALANGDGIIIYGEGTQVTPRVRQWTNATDTFGSESNALTVSTTTHMMAIETSPYKQEAIAVVQNGSATNSMVVQRYNGQSWSNDWQFTVGNLNAAIRFDVVYEQQTGKAMVIYSASTATTNELRYRIWDGDSWTAEQNLDAVRTSGVVGFVRAEARPGTDEIAVAWADNANNDISANYYDMSSGTWSGEHSSALSINAARVGAGTSFNNRPLDMTFENSSGELLICWGEEGVTDLKCASRTAGTSGTWSTSTYGSFTVEPVDIDLASEPGSDYVAVNFMDDAATPSAEAGIWNGGGWGSINAYDSSLNSFGSSTTNVGVEWLKSGTESRVVATYDDSAAAGIDWLSYNKGSSTWTTETDFTTSPSPVGGNDKAHVLKRNPHNNAEIMVLVEDNNLDLFAKKVTFDGSTISWSSVEGGAALETNMTNSSGWGWSVDFAYYALDNQDVIDTSVAESGTYHDGANPNQVFINDQTGYAFFRNRTGECAYAATTDGGTTWVGPTTVSPSSCSHVSIWYDRWTPGDTTGNYIHIVTVDTTVDDLKYNRLDTSSNTLLSGATPTAITTTPGPNFTNTLTSHDNYASITRATDGVLYMGVHDSDAAGENSYIIKCSGTCETASNWSNTSAGLDEGAVTQAKNYGLTLLPQASGNILAIVSDVTNNDMESKLYTAGTSSWAGAWTTIDAAAGFHATYSGSGFSAVVDKKTYDVYLAYTADANPNFGNGDDDFRTALYSGGSWTAKTAIITDDASRALLQPSLLINENNGDVYVAYTVRNTAADERTEDIMWKKSSDGMTTWGSEQGPLNVFKENFWGMHLNVSSDQKVYAVWTEAYGSTSAEPRTFRGTLVADLTPPTYTQSAYRLFANNNSTNVGSALALQDTPATLVGADDAFRVRSLLHTAGDGARASLEDFKLQYAGKGSGTCAAPTGGTPASYTDVTAGTLIAYNNNTPADGATLTTNANDPMHSGHSVIAQTYEELNNFTNSVAAIASGADGLWDFALVDNGAPDSTTYCLRVIKSDGTALTAYSQYPEVTTGTSNQAPNNPASLVQKKTNDTVLATGDWTNESTVKFTASASDADASDTLQLCVEKKPLGTAFDSNAGAETCGTGVAYSGSPVNVEVSIGSHTSDEYHWQARTKDAAGSYSSWVSYGGNAESARDYGVDTTAPSGGTVYDGTSVGVDAAFNDNSLSSLSANWSGFNANISGLSRYEYSIGTTAGGTNVKGWTNNTTSTSVTATGLTLQTMQVYYFNVRAVDAAGNVQTAVSSDGQLVLPSLSFGISSNSLTFANLNATNSYTDTKTTTVTTSTNAYGGYVVRAFATDFLRASALTTIPDFNGGTYALPDSWQSGDTGFGYTSNDASIQGANKFQASTCPGGSALAAPGCYAPFSQTKPGDIVADHTANVAGTPITSEQFTLTYRVTAPSTQAGSSYATTIVYSVTPIY